VPTQTCVLAHLTMQLEARAYGVARAYEPFLVNTVVGLIGPEYLADARQITRAGLEDHFIGAISGYPHVL
jgi:ethanolamine ammonia-lyase large subunit